jgi:hypothetical protein
MRGNSWPSSSKHRGSTDVPINGDCVECVYDKKEGQAVVGLASGREIGIKMSARDFRDKAKALE